MARDCRSQFRLLTRRVCLLVANSDKDVRRKRLCLREVALAKTQRKDLAPDPEARVRNHQFLRVLREMVKRLPEPYRQVIELRFEQELSTSETARQLDISRSNAATRLHRALRMLKNCLEVRM